MQHMSTNMSDSKTREIPDALLNFRPACGMHELNQGAMPDCNAPATHVVTLHNNCDNEFTCVDCYALYRHWARAFVRKLPEGFSVVCKMCDRKVDPVEDMTLTLL